MEPNKTPAGLYIALAFIIGLLAGGVSGYYYGLSSGQGAAGANESAATDENPFAEVQTNPLQDVKTNPFE